MSELDDVLFRKLCDLVYEWSGMRFDERKKYFFVRRLEQRIEKVGASGPGDYYQMLRYGNGNGEIHELTESLTTNETYFFREYLQLKAFAEHVLIETLEKKRKRGNHYLRVWSAGCSTGDEPYTLAIILREMIEDFDRWEINLTATDIDRSALRIARQAVYSERAVKDVPTAYLERYFQAQEDGYRVKLPITRMVRFCHANLMDAQVAREMADQDFIFCRNVLIYFDDVSRRQVVDLFYSALNPGGYIFLGHSESVGRIASSFHLVRHGDALVYMK